MQSDNKIITIDDLYETNEQDFEKFRFDKKQVFLTLSGILAGLLLGFLEVVILR